VTNLENLENLDHLDHLGMIMSASSTQKKRGFLPGKSGELEEES